MRNKTKAAKHNLYVIQKLYLREHTGAAAVSRLGGTTLLVLTITD